MARQRQEYNRVEIKVAEIDEKVREEEKREKG